MRHVGLVAGAVALWACGGDSGSPSPPPAPPIVASVEVTASTTTLLPSASAQFTAVARDQRGATLTRSFTWTSDDVRVASVSSTGVVTGVGVGTTPVSATADGVRGSATVTVRAVPIASVTVMLAATTLSPGQTTTASAVVRDSLGSVVAGSALSWSSSNVGVATVTSTGLVTAVAAGSATISAAVAGKSGNAALLVVPAPVASVTLVASDVGLFPGATTAVRADLRDAAGRLLSGRSVTWTSNNSASAAVDANGNVRAVALGEATITGVSEGTSGSTAIQVVASGMPWIMRDSVAVLEYPSVYTVHPVHDPLRYPNMRVQPATFDMLRVLADLESIIDPSNYDFVLLFSLQEVPGWIHSGARYALEAKNLGLRNTFVFTRPPRWNRARSAPHMNNLDFFDPSAVGSSQQTQLTIAHEIAHQWGVYFAATNCQSFVRLTEWRRGIHPTACLATITSHWTYLWKRPEGPGILESGASNPRFNEFDLYAMGLMGYNEAKAYTHMVREDAPLQTAPEYPVTIDTLLASLQIAGPTYCQGDCRRVPDTDPTATAMRALVVIVKGSSEQITELRRRTALKIVREFPTVWRTATLGRSDMNLALVRR